MINYKDLSQIQEISPKPLSPRQLLRDHGEKLKLSLKNSQECLESSITSMDLHRPGLALAGFLGDYAHSHIQLIGHTEWNYLESVGEDKRKQIFFQLSRFKSPLWILTHGLSPHKELSDMCENLRSPLMTTELPTVKFARPIQRVLEDWFARSVFIHGSLVDVFGVGVLFLGDSGVGKSECVLDLIERGHCLVADDAVDLRRIGDMIFGTGRKGFNQYVEIRGVGIIDVRSMFGVKAVRYEKRLDIILELQKWDPEVKYNRTGLDTLTNKILGLSVPHCVIPVLPGKNITTVSEAVAMDYLLKKTGINVSANMNEHLKQAILEKTHGDNMRGSIKDSVLWQGLWGEGI